MWKNHKLGFGDVNLSGASGQIEASFTSDKYTKLRLRMCHAGMNRQGFIITQEALSKACSTLSNIPVLAHVIQDEDGNYAFGNHDMHIESSAQDSEPRLIYDEAVIGVIPESCNYAEEEYDGRVYACVDAYVYTWYSNYAQDVLASHSEVPVSIEMQVNAAYRDDSDVMIVTDYTYNGVTLLGDDVTPACIGAKGIVTQLSSEGGQTAFTALCEDVTKIVMGQEESENLKEDNELKDENKPVELTEETIDTGTSVDDETQPEQEEQETVEETVDNSETESTTVNCSLSSAIQLGLVNSIRQIKDDDGYPEYYMHDFDPDIQKVYLSNYRDGYIYAASYAVDGDSVVVKEPFIRQTLCYRDYVDGDHEAAGMSALLSAYRNVESLTAELTELRAEHDAALAAKKETEIKMAAEEFTDIADMDEYKALLSEAAQFPTVEEFKEKCYAIRGKNMDIKQLQAAVSECAKGGLRAPLGLSVPKDKKNDASSPLEKLAKQHGTRH